MIYLSCACICGEDDFSVGIGERQVPAEMAEILRDKKAGYPLDMEGFWPGDNCRIIAERDTFARMNACQNCFMLGKQADGEGMAF